MSHYTVWHLIDSVRIKDIVGLRKWMEELENEESSEWKGFSGMVPLMQISEYDSTVEETPTRKVIEKVWLFDGLYGEAPEDKKDDLYYANGYYSINHFCIDPHHSDRWREHTGFLAKLSTFMAEEIVFFVFDEGWPTLEMGYVKFVTAFAGDVVAVPMHLQKDER